MNIQYKMNGFTCLTPCPFNTNGTMVNSSFCKHCYWFGGKKKKEDAIICNNPIEIPIKRKKEKKKNYVWIIENSIDGKKWKPMGGDCGLTKRESYLMIEDLINNKYLKILKYRAVKYETTN